MEWTVEPIGGFSLLVNSAAADTCSGGSTLDHCTVQGALIVCTCGGGLKFSQQA
jgi:hypothetical protein